MFTSHHFQRHYQNCESASTPQSGTSHKTCLRGFGGNGSIAWTSAVSHEGLTSNAFKVTMKLPTFLFQMEVTSYISLGSYDRASLAKCEERENQQDVYYQLLSQHVLGIIIPIFGRTKTVCYCIWCTSLVLLDVVGSGCGPLRCRMRAL